MKKLLLWVLILIITCMPAANAADDYDEIISGILAHLSNGADIQAWIDDTLCQGAGGSMDNLLPPLMHMRRGYDFSGYAAALEEKLASGIKSVTTRQRSALMLAVLGHMDKVPAGFADETIGEMGVMSYVYGLHLLNHGFASENWTKDGIIDMLACLQLSDGGWAVSGQYSDPDVTAMCLQALAAAGLKADGSDRLIETALAYLSASQNDDGSYSSYGNPACESSAQVILALNSLNINSLTDERFIKNDKTALDSMLSFRLADGSFSHIDDGKTNVMACIQALSALISLKNPGLIFFDFEGLYQPAKSVESALPMWKIIVLGCTAVFFLGGSIASLLKKRAKGKRFLMVLLVSAAAVCTVFAIDIESTSSYYSEVQKDEAPAGQVWLSIDCTTVAGREDEKITPADGAVLPRTQFDFYNGDSVFDVLTYAARKYAIQLEYDGATRDFAYLNGINHLYEYAYGELSGWIYTVNGQKQSIGCGNYMVADGDEIIWHYTLELGEDIK